MPSCVIPTCRIGNFKKTQHQGTTLHVFPADEERNAHWTKIIQKARQEEYWIPPKKGVICSKHFEQQFFYTSKGGLRKLKKEAYPNKNLTSAPELIETQTTNSNDNIGFIDDLQPHTSTQTNSMDLAQEKCDTESGLLVSHTVSKAPSPTGISDVDISDLDYIFDTPRTVKLKKQLRRKQIIQDRHVRKINTLIIKNRRLAKKYESLKNILKNLIENRYVNDDAYDLLSTDVVAANIFNNIYRKNIKNKKRPNTQQK